MHWLGNSASILTVYNLIFPFGEKQINADYKEVAWLFWNFSLYHHRFFKFLFINSQISVNDILKRGVTASSIVWYRCSAFVSMYKKKR